MKKSPEELLVYYRKALRKYEAEGNAEMIEIQKRLIARLEAHA